MAERKHEDIARLAAQTFGTESGEVFLEYLNETYFRKLIFAPGLDALSMAHNDGKRFMVHHINQLVAQGKTGKKLPAQAITDEEE